MKLPRDLSGGELIRRLGYEATRQTGSHIRLTYTGPRGEHHLTVPLHSPLRVGTLNALLQAVASHLEIRREELLKALR